MSETLELHDAEKAKAFNSRQSFFILPEAIEEFPGLSAERASDAFYHAVLALQAELCVDADGFYGKATHAEMINAFGTDMDFIVVDGARLPIQTDGLFYVEDFTENSSIDLHKYGNFSRRKDGIEFFMIHHGGLNPHHLARVFSNTERKVSSHFGIGLDDNGNVVVCQYLDTKWKSWHGGGWNEGSLGIDICFQPDVKWNGKYGVSIIDNPSIFGPRRINELPQEIVNALVKFLSQMSLIFHKEEYPVYAPEVDRIYSKEEFQAVDATVVGHHHKTRNKWDVGYAWQRLIDTNERLKRGEYLGEEEGDDVS